MHKVRFKLQVLSVNPIRALEKWFDNSLINKAQYKSTMEQLRNWLATIDRTPFSGKLRSWCYHFGSCRVCHGLSLYRFPLHSSNLWRERRVIFQGYSLAFFVHLVMLICIQRGFPASLPIWSIVEECKIRQVGTALVLRHTSDPRSNR